MPTIQPDDEGPPARSHVIVNFVVFQAVYAACVLGAANGHLWLGPLAGLLLFPLNLRFVSDRGAELRLWIAAGLVGAVLDSGLLALGVFDFPAVTRIAPETALSGWVVPPWIVTLWVAVGTALRSSLAWLGRDLRLAVLFGALGGPLSFWSGSRLGATILPLGPASFAALSVEYAVVLPLLLILSGRRSRPQPTSVDGEPPPSLPTTNETPSTIPPAPSR